MQQLSIVHVAGLAMRLGYSKKLQAAGWLHDTVEMAQR